MYYEGVRADEGEKLVEDGGERRLTSEKFCGQAMDGECILGHLALGIDVSVKFSTGRNMMNEFDASDLDDAMSLPRIETSRFGIQNDFAHHPLLSPGLRTRVGPPGLSATSCHARV